MSSLLYTYIYIYITSKSAYTNTAFIRVFDEDVMAWECHDMETLSLLLPLVMTTSSYGNISRVTGPLKRESTDLRWITLTKASDTEL